MSKYNAGETSSEVREKQKSINKSILKKCKLIKKIKTYEDIPPSLVIKKNYISESAVHKWSDEKLGVISYAWNTAHTEYNHVALDALLDAINTANKELSKGLSTTDSVEDPGVEINQLRTALAEVYRAYMQLIDFCKEDKEIDESLRNLIKNQAKVLGKQRIWSVK